jgi:heptosyltransferase I
MDLAGKRIGVVMMSAVGDAVHVLPVINAIKRQAPDAHITWVLQPGPATLVRGHSAVDEILLFERAGGLRAFDAIRRELRTRPFDLVLALQVYFKAGIVTGFTRAPVKLGFDRARARDFNWLFTTHRIPAGRMRHVQDQYFEFLDALDVSREPVEWDLGPWPDERDLQRELLAPFDRPIVPLVIGTSKEEKDWLPERWAELADILWIDYELQPVLVGGRSARELATESAIMQRARHRPASLLGSGLRPLVSILEAAPLVVSLDTGPLHMTVALDRPVISLIGYSNPKRVGPYRKFHDLLIDAYGDPGEHYPISIVNRPGRMPRIQVRDVVEKVEIWKKRYRDSEPGARPTPAGGVGRSHTPLPPA